MAIPCVVLAAPCKHATYHACSMHAAMHHAACTWGDAAEAACPCFMQLGAAVHHQVTGQQHRAISGRPQGQPNQPPGGNVCTPAVSLGRSLQVFLHVRGIVVVVLNCHGVCTRCNALLTNCFAQGLGWIRCLSCKDDVFKMTGHVHVIHMLYHRTSHLDTSSPSQSLMRATNDVQTLLPSSPNPTGCAGMCPSLLAVLLAAVAPARAQCSSRSNPGATSRPLIWQLALWRMRQGMQPWLLVFMVLRAL